ncbi:MAG: heparinase II/III family protein [Clostridia bacterium]|nr:heparinase II/III family protein [Clostridia bacterium]
MSVYDFDELRRCTLKEKGKLLVNRFKDKYEKEYKGKPITALSFSDKKLYYINGDRSAFEKQYYDRRNRLALLQVLAVADDSYLDELEDVLFAICEESTWVLPAHNLLPDNTFDHTVIDLFSAETALYLSETVYTFGSKLSPYIVKLIRSTVEERIIKNYENRVFDFERATINWASVCACGVGLSFLYLFPDKFNSVKERLFSTFKSYLEGFDEQGICDEGMVYWQYGFAMFSVFFNAYIEIMENRPDFLDDEKTIRVLKYAQRTEMGDGVYFPFADGGAKKFTPGVSSFLTIKNLYKNDFTLPHLSFFDCDEKDFKIGKPQWLKALYYVDEFLTGVNNCQRKDVTTYYESAQIFFHRNKTYSFVVKGGNNGDSHNHNDVGAFQIVKDSKRLITDYGAGKYTKDYFNEENGRYSDDVFVCGSQSHSVPIIDGTCQSYGKEYKARLVKFDNKSITFDLVGAYKVDCRKVLSKYTVFGERVQIEYLVDGINNNVIFRFASDIEPKLMGGFVQIADMKISCDRSLVPNIRKINIEGHFNPDVIYIIDYQVINEESVEIKFDFSFEKGTNE